MCAMSEKRTKTSASVFGHSAGPVARVADKQPQPRRVFLSLFPQSSSAFYHLHPRLRLSIPSSSPCPNSLHRQDFAGTPSIQPHCVVLCLAHHPLIPPTYRPAKASAGLMTGQKKPGRGKATAKQMLIPKVTKKPQFQCPQCKELVAGRSGLTRHLGSKHKQSKHVFKCPVGPECFNTAQNAEAHFCSVQ